MSVVGQVAPVAGCALMLAVCLVVMGGAGVRRWWRARWVPAILPVEELQREIAALRNSIAARDRARSAS